MKFKTKIDIICSAADKEEASHIAGEYLRGAVEYGVEMKCRTVDLSKRRALNGAIVVLFLGTLIFTANRLKGNETVDMNASLRMPGTCTVQPELKTSQGAGFREEWESRKDKAILDYLKK